MLAVRLSYLFYIFLYMVILEPGCSPEDADKGEVDIPEDVYGVNPALKDQYLVGVVITAYERPDVLRTTLESLAASELDEDVIVVVVDDYSRQKTTVNIIKNFTLKKATLVKLRLSRNRGLLNAMLTGFDKIEDRVAYLINLDPDVYVKKNWVKSLVRTFESISDDNIILTGFNTLTHPILQCSETEVPEFQNKCCKKFDDGMFYCEKKDIGGINFFYSRNFYKRAIKPVLLSEAKGDWQSWDWNVVHFMQMNNFKMITSSPSLIQHLGTSGTNTSPDGGYDFAPDF